MRATSKLAHYLQKDAGDEQARTLPAERRGRLRKDVGDEQARTLPAEKFG
jgi:hypothetical protein